MSRELSDDQLLETLREGLAVTERAPEHALTAARELLSKKGFDAELAELVFDSASDGLVGVRGADAARQLTFRAPGVEIEVMVMAEGERHLIGQLVPPQSATVELRSGATVRETGTDNLGRFQFTGVATGEVQLMVQPDGGTRIVTEWLLV